MTTPDPSLRELYDACFDEDIPRIKELIRQGISLKGKVPMQAGDTLLHCPCVQMDSEIAKLLIEAGAELDARNRIGRTPLMCAVFEGDSMLNLLIEKGASLELKDDEGLTALDIAEQCRPEAAEIIKNALRQKTVREENAAAEDLQKAHEKETVALHKTAVKRQSMLNQRPYKTILRP